MSGGKSTFYLKGLQNLLPRGAAWNRRLTSQLGKLLHGFGDEFNRVDCALLNLIEDFDPRSTSKLSDWERVLGLPDACTQGTQTTATRRSRILARITNPENGQNVQFYIDLAALLGHTITASDITSFQAFVVGRGTVGSVFPDGSSDPPQRLTNGGWPYWATITAPADECQKFKVGFKVGETLNDCNDDEFECVFVSLKPAHVEFDFNFV